MKHCLLLFILLGNYTTKTNVYLCDSSTAKRYHLNKNCKGLKSCQHRIVTLTLEQAKKKGRTLCGWEK